MPSGNHSGLNQFLQILSAESRADEQFLPRAGAQGDSFPAIRGLNGDVNANRPLGIAYPADYARNHGANLVRGKQTLQRFAHAIDDGMLYLELSLGFAKAHALHYPLR